MNNNKIKLHDESHLPEDLHAIDKLAGEMFDATGGSDESIPSGLTDRLYKGSINHLCKTLSNEENQLHLVGSTADQPDTTQPAVLHKLRNVVAIFAAAAAVILVAAVLIHNLQSPTPIQDNGTGTNTIALDDNTDNPVDTNTLLAYENALTTDTDLDLDLARFGTQLIDMERTMAVGFSSYDSYATTSSEWDQNWDQGWSGSSGSTLSQSVGSLSADLDRF